MNTTEKRNALIGAGILGLIIIALTVWYMAYNPPKASPIGQVPNVQTPPSVFPKEVIRDEGEYHAAEAAYPLKTPLLATAGEKADAAAVSLLKSFGESQIASFKQESGLNSLTQEDIEMLGLGDERKYAIALDFEVADGHRTITYVYTIYMDTGGAHPNGTYRTFTFDKASGAVVTANDLFTGNYLERLSEISRAKLPGIISAKTGVEADLEYIHNGTEPLAQNFQTFAIKGSTLILIFPPYQVGPYVIGPQFVEVSFEDIQDILRAEYR